jgi:hypothetical protein
MSQAKKYMITQYASQADIDAMAGKETAAGPALRLAGSKTAT